MFQNVQSRLPRPHFGHHGRCRSSAATRDEERMSGGDKQPITERFRQLWRAKWLDQPISSGLDNKRAQTAARAYSNRTSESFLRIGSFEQFVSSNWFKKDNVVSVIPAWHIQALNVLIKLYYVFRLGVVNENLFKFHLSKFNSLQSRFNLLKYILNLNTIRIYIKQC